MYTLVSSNPNNSSDVKYYELSAGDLLTAQIRADEEKLFSPDRDITIEFEGETVYTA